MDVDHKGNTGCSWNYVRSPELVDGVFPQLVELDLLWEDIQRHVDRTPQPPAALIVIQDGVEAGPVPVEEVLVPERVKVPDSPGRVAQQGVRELVQRPKLSLEPQPTHLQHQNCLKLAVRKSLYQTN